MLEIKNIYEKMFSGKNKVTNLIIVLLIAVAFLVVSATSRSQPKQVPSGAQVNEALELEGRLGTILSQIKGAGRVSVMIVLDDLGQKEYAVDQKKSVKGESVDSEDKTVITGSSGNSEPVIVRTILPKVNGVIVVADGASNLSVAEELKAAVQAALPVLPHRIEIAERENKK